MTYKGVSVDERYSTLMGRRHGIIKVELISKSVCGNATPIRILKSLYEKNQRTCKSKQF